MHKNLLFVVVLGVALFTQSPLAQAALVLTVDITNPAATVMTATTAASQSTLPLSLGGSIYLENVFTSGFRNTTITGTLKPQLTANTFNTATNLSGSILLKGDAGFPLQFTSGTQALTGQTTANLVGLVGTVANFTGDIKYRDDFGNVTNTVIGQYRIIVPEPSSILCIGLTAASLVVARRRQAR